MYYNEGDWESVLFPCLSVRLAIVYFFCYFISVMLMYQARTSNYIVKIGVVTTVIVI